MRWGPAPCDARGVPALAAVGPRVANLHGNRPAVDVHVERPGRALRRERDVHAADPVAARLARQQQRQFTVADAPCIHDLRAPVDRDVQQVAVPLDAHAPDPITDFDFKCHRNASTRPASFHRLAGSATLAGGTGRVN